MSTTFYLETDGTTEWANQVIKNILHALIRPDQTDWADKLPIAEFAINSSHNKSTRFAPFKVNYGYLPTLQGLLDTIPDDVKPGIHTYADKAHEHLRQAHNSIITSRVFQTHYVNQLHWEEPDLKVGDRVWLSTKNLAMPKGQVQKLQPLFIGLFLILQAMPEKLNYRLKLPQEMATWQIHSVFHIQLLCPFVNNDQTLFPKCDAQYYYDYRETNNNEWVVNEIIRHWWNGKVIEFHVHWSLGDTTWEPIEHCDELQALDEYLILMNTKDWRSLHKKTSNNKNTLDKQPENNNENKNNIKHKRQQKTNRKRVQNRPTHIHR
jgi:hypothetical protein